MELKLLKWITQAVGDAGMWASSKTRCPGTPRRNRPGGGGRPCTQSGKAVTAQAIEAGTVFAPLSFTLGFASFLPSEWDLTALSFSDNFGLRLSNNGQVILRRLLFWTKYILH